MICPLVLSTIEDQGVRPLDWEDLFGRILFMARKLRRNEIDLTPTCVYHVVSRCVRQLRLLAGKEDGQEEAKTLCLGMLASLVEATAVELAGFAVMDNHVHLLLHVDAEKAAKWSAKEVTQRWVKLHPARDGKYRPIETPEGYLESLEADSDWVEATRAKLASIPQFMKEFKQVVAQVVNKKVGQTGAFWQGRYKIKAVLDEAQLVTTLCYIDLNPFAAGVGDKPEEAGVTSVKQRLKSSSFLAGHNQKSEKKQSARQNRQAAEPKLVSMPVKRAQSKGLFGGLTLERYRRVLDSAARLMRPGKRRLSSAEAVRPVSVHSPITPQGVVAGVYDLCAYWQRCAPGVTRFEISQC